MELKIESIMHEYGFAENLWDIIRLVNPVEKKVIDSWINQQSFTKDELAQLNSQNSNLCYKFWNTGKICENCTSMKAINAGKKSIKMEFNGQKTFLISAIPIRLDEKNLVLEMLNDVTDSGILEDMGQKSMQEVYKIIEEKNKLLISDPLTGIYNKRFILERLPYEINEALQKNYPLFIVMADIDYFKKVNDNYGHLAGDYILKEFSSLINKNMRSETDWIARYGGEEFIIFFKNISKQDVKNKIERIRLKIQQSIFKFEKDEIRITSSFGISELRDSMELMDVIKEADQNLYKAKQNGRNQSCGI